MYKKILNVLALILSCSSCTHHDSGVNMDMNGFVLGDDQSSKPLLVGVGKSVDSFLVQNLFLSGLGIQGGSNPLNLPIMTRIDATYDDGVIRFHVGCSATTNIDGNGKYIGITGAEFKLCEPAINDWTAATHRTEQLISEFERQHPSLVSLRTFRKSATRAEAEKIWEYPLFDPSTETEFPLTEMQANQFFKQSAEEKRVQELKSNPGMAILMAAYANEQTLIFFSIAKTAFYDGDNLSVDEKNTVKYQTIISFLQRKSVAKLNP